MLLKFWGCLLCIIVVQWRDDVAFILHIFISQKKLAQSQKTCYTFKDLFLPQHYMNYKFLFTEQWYVG